MVVVSGLWLVSIPGGGLEVRGLVVATGLGDLPLYILVLLCGLLLSGCVLLAHTLYLLLAWGNLKVGQECLGRLVHAAAAEGVNTLELFLAWENVCI